jgi:hypothetical protein
MYASEPTEAKIRFLRSRISRTCALVTIVKWGDVGGGDGKGWKEDGKVLGIWKRWERWGRMSGDARWMRDGWREVEWDCQYLN